MLFVQLKPTRDSTSELLDALRQREVAVFGPSTPGQPERQMKKMEHRSGTFLRDSLHIMHCGSALRTAEAAAQQQQHSSSGGSDVAATDEKDERG